MDSAIGILLSDGWAYVAIWLYLFGAVVLESSRGISQWKRIVALGTMWLFTLFIGLRWQTGTDWSSYKTLFDGLETSWSFLLNVYHFDLGYVLFNGLVKLFTDSYTVFLLINSFITIWVLWRLIRRVSPYPNISWFFFYSAFMISQFMGSNRRMMAMVFLLWAFYWLYERRRTGFFLLVGLAFLFHRSAIVGLGALLIPFDMWKRRRVVLALLCCLVVGLLQVPAKVVDMLSGALAGFTGNPLIEKLVFYNETGDQHLVSSMGSLVIQTVLALGKRCVFLMFYFYVAGRNNIDRLTGWFFNIYIVAFSGYLLFVGSFFQMLTAYFALIEVLLLGRMYGFTDVKTKQVALVVIFLYSFAQLLSALNVYPDLYMPYRSVL